MVHKEDKFLEIAVGSPKNRNTYIAYDELAEIVSKRNEPIFRSYYYYDKGLVDHLESGKTVASFRGINFNCFMIMIY